MNRVTREDFKRFSCQINIGGNEYDCVPNRGKGYFLLALDSQQQDDLREKISTMDNVRASCNRLEYQMEL